jgi:hypothetical protein
MHASTLRLKYLTTNPNEKIKEQAKKSDEGKGGDGSQLPPHIFELARGNRDGSSILVDTKRGTIIWWKYDTKFLIPGDVDPYQTYNRNGNEDQRVVDQTGPVAWKIMSTYRPQTFVEVCKEQFRIMK